MAVLNIPIAKGGATLPVETDEIPEAMYALALAEGLKVILNKAMSKIGAVTKLEGEEKSKAQADAMEIAKKNLDELMAGTIKSRGAASKSKVAGIIMTEARRLAKEVVKNEIRAAGQKVSHVEASQITAMANALIEADPSFIETATVNIESRKSKTETDAEAAKAKLVKLGFMGESPKLVAKAQAEAAAKKTQLSAKQAGLPKVPSAKPSHAHH